MEQYGDFAVLYDDLMQDIPYDRWAAFIMECTGARRGDTGVDCACGTGSLTVRLSDKGLKMMGVDISESMLEQAAQKARKAAQRIMFICQDIARLYLPKQVSLITCACDGVNYLDNIKKAEAFFSAAYRALREGGAFIFDISTEYKFMHVLNGQLYYEDRKNVSYFWRNEFLPQHRLMNMELTFFVRKKNGEYTRFDETHVQRCYTEAELRALLHTAGFKEIETYEDYTKRPVGGQSMRITFCARK